MAASPARPMTLGLVSPGSPPREEPFEKGIAWLEANGFRIRRGTTARPGLGLHAGSPEERAADFQRMMEDPEVQAVLCTRGGGGTMGILPHLDYRRIRQRPKPVIGLSDITALHLALYKSCGMPGISAQVLVQLADKADEYTRQGWLSMVRGETGIGPVGLPAGSRLEVVSGGPAAQGPLFPCNLSLVSSLAGTSFLPSLRGAVLVVEEIDETPHSLDRMVTRLSLTGVCDGLAGLVLGQFTGCVPRGGTVTEEEGRSRVREWALGLGVPVLAGFPYGHESVCCALPFGTRVRLTTDPPGLDLLDYPPAPGRTVVGLYREPRRG